MKISKVIDIITKDDQETFDIEELVGQDAPFAYHINYGYNGFAKFSIDCKSIKAFETNLDKIESSLDRNHLYFMMHDMLKNNALSGAQLLKIINTNLVSETKTDVLFLLLN